MDRLKKCRDLLAWMETFLQEKSEFSAQDVAIFFDDFFMINTNGRIIQATPTTYRDYLYRLKSTLHNVAYDLGETFEAKHAIIMTFIIHLNFLHKPTQSLRAISIFKFSPNGRIEEWIEVFADAYEQKFEYDPS